MHAVTVDSFFKMESISARDIPLPKPQRIGKVMSLSFTLHVLKLQID
jgi:hypothetical protein